MAKLKIKKLYRENQLLQGRLNDITAAMAVMAHRSGGHIKLSKTDLMSLPEASFSVHRDDNFIELTLVYATEEVEDAPVAELVTDEVKLEELIIA